MLNMLPTILLGALASAPAFVWGQVADPTSLASKFSFTTSTSMPFPTATLSADDAQAFLVSSWSLGKGRVQNGVSNLAFVEDPFPNASAPSSTGTSDGPVLQVTYPQGQFGSTNSGMQLYSLWNTSDGSQFNSMLLTYEVAFDQNFPWVQGGKLPGLRGGDPDSCSGGNAATGTNCFSTRLMWRKDAAGEVYAYMPTPNKICSNSDFICNSDGFGTSIDRGTFTFVAGQWNRVSLIVELNSPADIANGQVALYYNNVPALNETVLQYRSTSSIPISGLYLSTFFGGNDASWAPPETVHAYFRDFQLWGSSAASTLAGAKVSAASRSTSVWYVLFSAILATAFGVW